VEKSFRGKIQGVKVHRANLILEKKGGDLDYF
jgi:hypothetical protein